MNTLGTNIIINFYGSVQNSFGIIVENFPINIKININDLNKQIRKTDSIDILFNKYKISPIMIKSGLENDYTNGDLLIFELNIEKSLKLSEQLNGVIRPNTTDFILFNKNCNESKFLNILYFELRLLPLLILGEICNTELKNQNILVYSHIKKLKNIEDTITDDAHKAFNVLSLQDYPVYDMRALKLMVSLIKKTHKDNNTVGGVVETFVDNLPIGLGGILEDNIQSSISYNLLKLPLSKGITFGRGFELSELFGKECIDDIGYQKNSIRFSTNNLGGISEGVATGNKININVAYCPSPKIKDDIKTINIIKKQNITLSYEQTEVAAVLRLINYQNSIVSFIIYDLISKK